MDVRITTVDLHTTALAVDFGPRSSSVLNLAVSSQGNYRRVVATVDGLARPVALLGPTYVDLSTGETRSPFEQAATTPRRMHPHVLHGRDVRSLVDAGLYSMETGAIARPT